MTFLVHAIGHIEINTNDVAGVVRDATEILGLHVTHQGTDQTWLSSNGRAAEVVLPDGPLESSLWHVSSLPHAWSRRPALGGHVRPPHTARHRPTQCR